MEDSSESVEVLRVLLSADDEVLEATNPEAGIRFAEEIAFLGNFVPDIGRAFGMKSIRFGIVEDEDGQVAFRFGGGSGEVEGLMREGRWEIDDVVSDDLWEEAKGEG